MSNKWFPRTKPWTNNNLITKKDVETLFPISKTWPFEVYPDERMTISNTGAGNIETFLGNNVINYNNGYKFHNPKYNSNSIVYNPKTESLQDVALDALHVARKEDPIYQKYWNILSNEWKNNDYVLGDAYENTYENAVDGTIRGLLYTGSDKKTKRYDIDEKQVLNTKQSKQTFSDLYNYLTAGYINPSMIISKK